MRMALSPYSSGTGSVFFTGLDFEAVSDLPPRPFLPQDNRSALVKTDSVKRILSNV
jgi:hypothetical protein